MKPNQQILEKVLDIAVAKGETGFEESDISSLFSNNQHDLIFHLDYLTDKGFIIGEFVPVAFATFGISPQSIRFIRGNITARGKEYWEGLKEQKKIMIASV